MSDLETTVQQPALWRRAVCSAGLLGAGAALIKIAAHYEGVSVQELYMPAIGGAVVGAAVTALVDSLRHVYRRSRAYSTTSVVEKQEQLVQ